MKKTRLISVLLLSTAVVFAGKARVGFEKPELARSESNKAINLVINSETAIHGLQFDLSYNSSEVKFESASVSDKFMFKTREISEGVIRGVIFSMEGLVIDEDLKFEFSPLAGFNGISTIDFIEVILADSQGNEVEAEASSYEINFDASLPSETGLNDAYPNPFNPSTAINYGLTNDNYVEIMIYDATGRLVEELVAKNHTAGYHSITWNASNQASGMYFAKMVAGDVVQTHKLMLLK
tara:strand:- start:2627 stop:3340 length:714 start_codon:yes stop_codon:yes gene_type:complete